MLLCCCCRRCCCTCLLRLFRLLLQLQRYCVCMRRRDMLCSPGAQRLPAVFPGVMAKVYTLKDVSSHEFVKEYAQHLKKTGKMDVPKWVDLAKTAPFKELAPYDEDYYYIRAASIARKVYLRQGTGVGAFRKVYGGSKNRGTKMSHFQKASGGLIRSILINLEKMGVVEKCGDGKG